MISKYFSNFKMKPVPFGSITFIDPKLLKLSPGIPLGPRQVSFCCYHYTPNHSLKLLGKFNKQFMLGDFSHVF